MSKGAYSIGENSNNRPKKDTSFRSFICILLIFLTICLIILLASLNWGNGKTEPSRRDNNKKEDVTEVLGRTGNKHNETHERIVYESKSTTLLPKLVKVSSTEGEGVITRPSTAFKTKQDIFDNELSSPYSTTPFTSIDITSRRSADIDHFENSTARDLISTTETIRATSSVTEVVSGISSEKTITYEDTSDKSEKFETTTIEAPFSSTNIAEVITESITEKFTNLDNSTETLIISTVIPNEVATTETLIRYTDRNEINRDRLDSTTTESITEKFLNVTNSAEDLPNSTVISDKVTSTESTENTTSSSDRFTDLESSTTMTNSVDGSSFESSTEFYATSETNILTKLRKKLVETSSTTSTTTQEVSIVEQDGTDVQNNTTTPENLILLKSPVYKKIEESVCSTSACNETAAQILGQMDHTDAESLPCEDFYQFACGGAYHERKETAETRNLHVLTKQLNNVKDGSKKFMNNFQNFYDSCLQYENDFNYSKRVEGVKKLLATVGQFQLMDSKDEILSYDLTDLVSKLILHQSMPLFDVGIDVDKESSNLILQLTLPQQSPLRTGLDGWSGLSLHKELCLKKQKSHLSGPEINLNRAYTLYLECQTNYSSYLDSIENILKEFEIFSKLDHNKRRKEIQDIRMEIEFKILSQLDISPTNILGDVLNRNYDVRKISDLQVQYPLLQWKKLFETLTGHNFSEDTTVQVYFGRHLHDMFESFGIIEKTSFRNLNNALLAIYANNLFINTVIPVERSNRESFCLGISKTLLPDVWAYVSKLDLSSKSQQYQNEKTTNLFRKLKKNFCESFTKREWIDDSTLLSFKRKCDNLDLALFTPPEEATLTKQHQDLKLGGDYQTDLINLLEHFKRTIYSTERTSVSASTIFSYFLDPLSGTPLTLYATNIIYVPLGLMRRIPKDVPNYLMIARAGFALAREMARHYDPVGMKYGIRMSSKTRPTYLDLVSTFDSMIESRARSLGHSVINFELKNGSLSTNQRIVDSTAFRLVWDSVSSTMGGIDDKKLMWVSSTYSNEQIFFIAVAQEFCAKTSPVDYMLGLFERRDLPPVLRVESIMSNSKEFSSKFGCGDGSGMNPPTKMQFPYLEKADSEYYEDQSISNKK